MNTEIKKIKEKFRAMDVLFFEAEKGLNATHLSPESLHQLKERIQILETYYHSGEWIKEREMIFALTDEDYESFHTAGEDAIWDLMERFYTKFDAEFPNS